MYHIYFLVYSTEITYDKFHELIEQASNMYYVKYLKEMSRNCLLHFLYRKLKNVFESLVLQLHILSLNDTTYLEGSQFPVFLFNVRVYVLSEMFPGYLSSNKFDFTQFIYLYLRY